MTTTRRRGGRAPLSPAPVDRTLVERTLPLPDLLLVQTITCVGLAVAFLLDEPGWWGAACGFGAGLLLVMPVAGRSSVRWALARVDFWRDRRRRRAIAHWAPFDHEQSDGMTVGLSWDGKTLTSLIRVDQAPPALHVLSPGGAVSGPTVPVGVLADCLRTFDVALQSIDVISHGRFLKFVHCKHDEGLLLVKVYFKPTGESIDLKVIRPRPPLPTLASCGLRG